MRVARAGQRAGAEQRAAQVRAAAARPADDALRRTLERRAGRREHAGLAQDVERVRVDGRRGAGSGSPARTSAAGRCGSPIARRGRAAARTRAARSRELIRSRWTAIVPPRRCHAPEGGRARRARRAGSSDAPGAICASSSRRSSESAHSVTPSSSSSRRLYSTPCDPQLPMPGRADDAVHAAGTARARSGRRRCRRRARRRGRPASAASSP